uniref:Cadherin domain-containing protein n=1 Tax=Knipowitschia caucasica TaxID=637954 RepID=A0AAV2MJA1_KNICA
MFSLVTKSALDRETQPQYEVTDHSLFGLDRYTGQIRTLRSFTETDEAQHKLVILVKDNGNVSLSATAIVLVKVVEAREASAASDVKSSAKDAEDTNVTFYLMITLASVSALFIISIIVLIAMQCSKSSTDYTSKYLQDTNYDGTLCHSIQYRSGDKRYMLVGPRMSVGSTIVPGSQANTLVLPDRRRPSEECAVAQIRYSVPEEEVTDHSLFGLDRYTGQIRTLRSFTETDEAQHKLVILVKDNGNVSLSATATVLVKVVEAREASAASDVKSSAKDAEDTNVTFYLMITLASVSALFIISIIVLIAMQCSKSSTDYTSKYLQDTNYDGTLCHSIQYRSGDKRYMLVGPRMSVGSTIVPGSQANTLVLPDRRRPSEECAVAQIRYSVPEEVRDGTVVGNVAKDLGLDVSSLRERRFRVVSESNEDIFAVNADDGALYVHGHIDREQLCQGSEVTSLSNTVSENSKPGTVVSLIRVKDKDSGVNGKIIAHITNNVPFELKPSYKENTYSVVTEDFLDREKEVTDHSLFGLDRYTGQIRTLRSFTETDEAQHKLVILVKDNGNVSLSATATVLVKVVEAREASAASDVKSSAKDAEDTNVTFYLMITLASVSALFIISIIVLIAMQCSKSSIDYTSKYLQDTNYDGTLCHSIQYRSGDKRYMLVGPRMSVGSTIVPGSQANTLVLPDRRRPSEEEVTDHSLFGLDRYTGQIRTLRSFTETDEAQHKLVILVKDNGNVSLSATATVLVKVVEAREASAASDVKSSAKDAEDTNVTFYLMITLASVSALFIISIIVLIAMQCSKSSTDYTSKYLQDTNYDGTLCHSIQYRSGDKRYMLVGPRMSVGSTIVPGSQANTLVLPDRRRPSEEEVTDHSLFGLDRYTGQIRTLRSFTETDEAQHKLVILVKDNGNVSLSATATVLVKVVEAREASAASDVKSSAKDAEDTNVTFYLMITLASVSALFIISIIVLIAMQCSKSSTDYTSKYLQDTNYDGTLCHSIQYRSGDKRYMLVGPRMSVGSTIVPGSQANTLVLPDRRRPSEEEVTDHSLFGLDRYTGQIRTLRSFTETDEAQHKLVILVKDNGNVSLSATATVLVKVVEAREASAASDVKSSAKDAEDTNVTFYLMITLASVSALFIISIIVLIAMQCSKSSTDYTSKYLQDTNYDGTLCHSIQYRSGDKRYMLVGPRMSVGSTIVPGSQANTLVLPDRRRPSEECAVAQIRYSVPEEEVTDHSLFGLDRYTGQIRTLRSFTETDEAQHKLVILVKDNGNVSLSATATVLVKVVEAKEASAASDVKSSAKDAEDTNVTFYLMITLASVSALFIISIIVLIAMQCSKSSTDYTSKYLQDTNYDGTLCHSIQYRSGDKRYMLVGPRMSVGSTIVPGSQANTLVLPDRRRPSEEEVTDHSLFGLDRYTGQIRTLRSFTETDEAQHKLVILVKDNGNVSLSATATVLVKVVEAREASAASDVKSSAKDAEDTNVTFYLMITLASVSALFIISIIVLIAMQCSKSSTDYTSKYLQDTNYDGTLCHSIQYRSGDKRYMLVGPRMSVGSTIVPGSQANTLVLPDRRRPSEEKQLDREALGEHRLVLTAVDGGRPVR